MNGPLLHKISYVNKIMLWVLLVTERPNHPRLCYLTNKQSGPEHNVQYRVRCKQICMNRVC